MLGSPLNVTAGATEWPVTWMATLAESVIEPEVPRMVAVYNPGLVSACAETVRVALTEAVPEMAAGWVTVHVGFSLAAEKSGETTQPSTTLPLKPFAGVILMGAFSDLPCATSAGGVALSVNSGLFDAGLMRYAAPLTLLCPSRELMAMASMVWEASTEMGPVYRFEAALGCARFV